MDNKFESMLEANKLTHEILEHCKETILTRKTISKKEVELLAEFKLNQHGVESAFKGIGGFPSVICVCINDEVIHGLPKEEQMIQEQDLVSLDFGVKVNGYCADAAISFINSTKISNPLSKKRKLVRATKEALDVAVKALENTFPNCRVKDITKVIESYKKDYGIVVGYGGHGIGKELHDSKIFIPNTWSSLQKDMHLKVGDFFTIEPMFSLGSVDTITDEDGFTIKTADGSLSAHFEYSIAITKDGIVVLK
jgi:methionyl aminopeptidase